MQSPLLLTCWQNVDETGLGLATDRIAGPTGERDHLRVRLRQKGDRTRLAIGHDPRVEHL